MTNFVQMPRVGFHRRVFTCAAIYNVGWGTFTALYPNWLFHHAGMPPANYPEIFAALGMVIGVYGLLYVEVARAPQHGFAVAFVGLLGKVLGPVGWILLVAHGKWPASTYVMCLFNDLIWWPAFALYLHDAWPTWNRRSSIS